MRTGMIARKIGMTRRFEADGRQVPITLLMVTPNVVLENLTQEKHGYSALKLGAVPVTKTQRLAKPIKGYFAKLKIEPLSVIHEFTVDENTMEPGTQVTVDHFQEGQYVDVTGVTRGKGFAGAMKRHGFHGLRASHGVSISHRSHGSTGNRQDPGRVFKNKKMAGHMGAKRRTQLNLKVYAIDSKEGLLYIKGSIPGGKGSVLFVRDAVKKSEVKKA